MEILGNVYRINFSLLAFNLLKIHYNFTISISWENKHEMTLDLTV